MKCITRYIISLASVVFPVDVSVLHMLFVRLVSCKVIQLLAADSVQR